MVNEIRLKFGVKLKKALHSKGLSQEKLAEKCGLSVEYISIVENGRKSPTLDT